MPETGQVRRRPAAGVRIRTALSGRLLTGTDDMMITQPTAANPRRHRWIEQWQ
jgi:hypothetical protein